MILQILFFIIFAIIGIPGSYLPGYGSVPLLLPWGLDEVFLLAMQYFYAFVAIFPPLGIVMTAFLFLLLWKLIHLFIKLFLGSRSPVQ